MAHDVTQGGTKQADEQARWYDDAVAMLVPRDGDREGQLMPRDGGRQRTTL